MTLRAWSIAAVAACLLLGATVAEAQVYRPRNKLGAAARGPTPVTTGPAINKAAPAGTGAVATAAPPPAAATAAPAPAAKKAAPPPARAPIAKKAPPPKKKAKPADDDEDDVVVSDDEDDE